MRSGFYRGILRAADGPGDEERAADMRAIKVRLVREMRRRPGNVHLMLQGNKALLRAIAIERHQRKSPEELAESMAGTLAGIMNQLTIPER